MGQNRVRILIGAAAFLSGCVFGWFLHGLHGPVITAEWVKAIGDVLRDILWPNDEVWTEF